MREKELRLALVCFGGVSLAVYMHGICTEILKLVRASAALHGIADRASRAVASFAHSGSQPTTSADTEPAYFDLLKAIGRKVELRVIVDIIAGASAGGINGTMLARALCHDLPIDRLSELWLDQADVHVLLSPEARAGRWSKLALKPLLWGAASTGLLHSHHDPEVRKNLSVFVRSRWFKPPFDGGRMTGLMLDAINALGSPSRPGASLIPSGQRLDLFVTLTDYHGRPELLQLHDPMFVHEREHRHVLHFGYRRNQDGEVENDFDLANGPGLAFAARATSSFPGAFPPRGSSTSMRRFPGARSLGPSDKASSRRASAPTWRAKSIQPKPALSMAACSTTGHSERRFLPFREDLPTARSTGAWSISIHYLTQ